MKYEEVIVCFFVFTALSHVAFAKSDYIAMMQSCDTEYENASKRANTTIEIVQVIDAHTECYKTIVSEIITSKYKQNHESMWNNFIQYIYSAADATSYIQRPDSCYPQCGSIIGINAATSKFDAAKQYLEQMIQINQ